MRSPGPKFRTRRMLVALTVVAGAEGCSLLFDPGSLSGEPGGGIGPEGGETGPEGGADEDAPDSASRPCPATRGPDMVRVGNDAGTISFCIDTTEVTEAQYRLFQNEKNIDAGGQTLPGQPSGCEFNNTYAPTSRPKGDSFPVATVDWCDAYMYCEWAGKRLCGKIGGGVTDYDASANPAVSQWMFACSVNGARRYPYGDTFNPNACNSGPSGAIAPVKNRLTCEGGFPGLFDLSGNLEEWEDACTSTYDCQARGGSFLDDADQNSCRVPFIYPRNTHDDDVGFRCCSDG